MFFVTDWIKKIHRIPECYPMNFKYSAGDLKSPAEYCFRNNCFIVLAIKIKKNSPDDIKSPGEKCSY